MLPVSGPQVVAAVVMSQAHCVYGTFICLGGQLIAESQAADTARLSIADATLVASITQAGRVFGELLVMGGGGAV